MTGRRPDYTVFSVDIGVTDVTRNRRLFAVTSTTCSTLLKELVVVTAVFSPPIDIKQPPQSSTPSQCPCRFLILATKKALNSRKLRDIYYMYIANTTRYQVHTYAVYSRVWRLGGLFSWSMGAGLVTFSTRQFAVTIHNGPFFVRFTLFFLPGQA